jgi:hypothetical protein
MAPKPLPRPPLPVKKIPGSPPPKIIKRPKP